MTREVDISIENAFRQAKMTAEHYLAESYKIIENYSDQKSNIAVAVELAKVMAQDFHTTIMATKIQEIRDKLEEISDSLSSINNRMPL